MPVIALSNAEIAAVLDRIAQLLETQAADPFRVRAYRNAAHSIRHQASHVADFANDLEALEALPAVGPSIARSVMQLVTSGHARILDRLEGQVAPEDEFTRIPGIGETLAARIHRELHLDTLEQLEVAAHNGQLQQLPGMGRRRVLAVQNALEALLRRNRGATSAGPAATSAHPSVASLLEIDAAYREQALAGSLPMITPRRFNPEGAAWLPVMHAGRAGWHFTALFSNTARAHELGRTRDWVVLIYERDGEQGQATVVTETRGSLQGRRVVRGREEECLAFYGNGPKRKMRPNASNTRAAAHDEPPILPE